MQQYQGSRYSQRLGSETVPVMHKVAIVAVKVLRVFIEAALSKEPLCCMDFKNTA